ncbi:MAG: NAD-dependent epimerase/dehydratase family protein [Kiritimatiellaeota bacterium]|nr:NAD-dependent epimerase/dehydratase family protein [Kiritimatiellota bacterium]
MSKSKQVLLIGGNGFIGSHLVDKLLAENCRVKVLDQFPERYRKPLLDVEYILDDYGDIGVLKKALHGCDTLIHLAHVGSPASAIKEADKEVLNSITAFVRMLEWLKGGMVGQFMFFSSGGAVYGVPDVTPVPEDYKGWPVSPYGVAKLSMEHYLHMFSAQNQLPYQIIRPSNPYGPRQNFLGSQGAISIFTHKILSGESIEIWGDGNNRKDYVYVEDLADAVIALMENGRKKEVYNVGSGEGVSLKAIISCIEHSCNVSANVQYAPRRSQDVPDIVLSCGKIKADVDWTPSTALSDGIDILRKWMQSYLKSQS